MPRARIVGWSWHPEAKYPRKNANGQVFTGVSGEIIPKALGDIFADESIQDAILQLRKIRRMLEKARASWNPFIAPAIIEQLERSEALLVGSIPYGLCQDCQGKIDIVDGCGLCMGQGWIPMASAKS